MVFHFPTMSAAVLIATSLFAGHTVIRAEEGTAAVAVPTVKTPDLIELPSAKTFDMAIGRGVDFLLADQNKDGSWGSATRTKGLNIYAPIPGAHQAFRCAATAMSIMAFYEVGGDRKDVRESLDRAEAYLMEHLPKVRRATGDAMYNVWTHCYSIQALVRMREYQPDDEERQQQIDKLVQQQFERLEAYASIDGGWGYYDFRYQTKQPSSASISFVNAAALVALYEAKEAGYDPPQPMVDKAIAATLRQRLPDFSYLYGEYLKWMPRRGINRPGGSLGRSQACNLALRMWGDKTVTDEVITNWLNRIIVRNGWLDIGRKRPIPHEAWFQVAGYFYYFGHYYAARCVHELPETQQPLYKAHLAKLMLDRQEKDGSWWDYPFYDYHQPYGTAFALMTLTRCR